MFYLNKIFRQGEQAKLVRQGLYFVQTRFPPPHPERARLISFACLPGDLTGS